MAKLIGTAPNQVPINAMLGKMAFVDKESAANVQNVPSGTISSTTVQGAINELATEKAEVSDVLAFSIALG